MCLNVPVRVRISGLVLLGARNLNLLEAPLGKIDVAGAQIASEYLMLQPEGRRKSTDLAIIPRSSVVDDLNLPVVLLIANRHVTVAGHFLVGLGDRSGDLVGVEVAAGLGVDQADNVVVSDEAGIGLWVVISISTVRVEEPVVVGILVVVAGHLLLCGALGIRLDVTVKQSSSIAHVLDSDPRPKGNFQRAVSANLGAA
jgi:hypothetical protein